jgi:hypothetical protein
MKTKTIYKGLLFLLGLSLFAGCSKSSDSNPTNSGSFTVNSTTYTGPCIFSADVGAGEPLGNIDVVIEGTSEVSFIVYNMPSQDNGTYSFTNGYNNAGSSQLYAIFSLNASFDPANGDFGTTGGTITKTGAYSFTFSCQLFDRVSNQSLTVTGKGSYY